MAKILFIPFSVVGGLLAGFVAKKLFDLAWGMVSDEEAPEPEHRRIPVGKLLLAAGIEGADHGSRRAFATLTGTWPGEEEPERE
jgi:hypothetical protein